MGHESQMRSLHSCMRFLPTKTDFEQYVKRIEKTYRQEITELKKDLGVRMEDMNTQLMAFVLPYSPVRRH